MKFIKLLKYNLQKYFHDHQPFDYAYPTDGCVKVNNKHFKEVLCKFCGDTVLQDSQGAIFEYMGMDAEHHTINCLNEISKIRGDE